MTNTVFPFGLTATELIWPLLTPYCLAHSWVPGLTAA